MVFKGEFVPEQDIHHMNRKFSVYLKGISPKLDSNVLKFLCRSELALISLHSMTG